jgi:hypothetical protein
MVIFATKLFFIEFLGSQRDSITDFYLKHIEIFPFVEISFVHAAVQVVSESPIDLLNFHVEDWHKRHDWDNFR